MAITMISTTANVVPKSPYLVSLTAPAVSGIQNGGHNIVTVSEPVGGVNVGDWFTVVIPGISDPSGSGLFDPYQVGTVIELHAIDAQRKQQNFWAAVSFAESFPTLIDNDQGIGAVMFDVGMPATLRMTERGWIVNSPANMFSPFGVLNRTKQVSLDFMAYTIGE